MITTTTAATAIATFNGESLHAGDVLPGQLLPCDAVVDDQRIVEHHNGLLVPEQRADGHRGEGGRKVGLLQDPA